MQALLISLRRRWKDYVHHFRHPSMRNFCIFFSDQELNINDPKKYINIARWFIKKLKHELAAKLPGKIIPSSNTYKDEKHLQSVVEKIIDASTDREFLRQIQEAEEARQEKARQQASMLQNKESKLF